MRRGAEGETDFQYYMMRVDDSASHERQKMKPFKEISNAALSEHDLPPVNDKWDKALFQFAMSFDGYCFIASKPTSDNTTATTAQERLGPFANGAMRTYEQRKLLPQSLTELRACLFFEGRRWHHVGSAVGGYEAFDKGGRAMNYVRALLEAIAHKIRCEERD